MGCGEFKENRITEEKKKVDNSKCFFINLCYPILGDSKTFSCDTNTTKFAIIDYNPTFLELFPNGYSESDFIGKIYSFEIEYIKTVDIRSGFSDKAFKNKELISSIIKYYIIFSKEGTHDNYREELECLKKSVKQEGEILDLRQSESDIFYSRCITYGEKSQLYINKISFFSKKISEQEFVPGFKVGGLKRKKNKTKTKRRKNKQRKSMKKKHHN